MALLTTKLTAHSIVEAMVAMIIIMLSFGIGMSIYMNILTSDMTIGKANANIILNEFLEKTKLEKTFVNQTFNTKSGVIEKSLKQYKNSQNSYLLELKYFDHKRQFIHGIKEILYLPQVE